MLPPPPSRKISFSFLRDYSSRLLAFVVVTICRLQSIIVAAQGGSKENTNAIPITTNPKLYSWLPTKSSDFFKASSCSNKVKFFGSDNDVDGSNDSFERWVLAARHVTWHEGWEVVPDPNQVNECDSAEECIGLDSTGNENSVGYYARVFDLLNWSRQQNLLPVAMNVSNICHKGMEDVSSMKGINDNARESADDANGELNEFPSRPNQFIPYDQWYHLWNTCHKQLISHSRISSLLSPQSLSSCIDIPGIVVANPNPPLKVNNPCHLEFRMVDGAHRICLRKYVLSLLWGELYELKDRLARLQQKLDVTDENTQESGTIHNNEVEMTLDEIYSEIRQKEILIDQTSHGMFFVIDQEVFQSFLMNLDPHSSWAQSQAILNDGIDDEFMVEWDRWMMKVMDHVWVWKQRYRKV